MGPADFWLNDFDERQRKQILWSQMYAAPDERGNVLFAHGDNGHNDKMIIYKMSLKLREYEEKLRSYGHVFQNGSDK